MATIAAITAAGLLSVSFLADTGGSLPLSPGSDLQAAATWVMFSLFSGASGLLWGLLGLVVFNYDWMRRWSGGCLVVSSAIVTALFPTALVLLLSTADAATAAGHP